MSSTDRAHASVIDLIKGEHRDVEALYHSYEQTENKDEKLKIARQLIKDISQHGVQEEMSIYPSVRHTYTCAQRPCA